MQFSQIDILDRIKLPKTAKFARNWRIFNKNEFKEELFKIDINPIFNPLVGTDESFDFFYKKTEKLLDEMAPLKKLSKKEIGLKQSPWITFGLITSMKDRDYLYRMYIKEKKREEKARYHSLFKSKRNRIISLLRTSKKQYYAQFFEENQTNIKKTWEGIRNLLNVSKNQQPNLTKLLKTMRFSLMQKKSQIN